MQYLILSQDHDRRVFIKGLGYVSMGLLLSTMGGCESCMEQIENRPTRRRLRTGSPEVDADIATYEQAVAAMKALPAGDQRSWDNQAAIHGMGNSFNFCEHGSDHFFSWHRAYLLFFERICQELSGNSDFGLPYWNWNQDPDMHPDFLDAASSLDHPRNNTSVAGFAAFSDSTLDTIFSDSNFYTFSSQLEGTPHNTVHNVVGQDMASGGSPLDPIFWPHHCMVDYCWAKWNLELDNDNTNDSTWLETSWNHFVDQDGNPAETTAAATVLMPLLSYQYESSDIGSSPAVLVQRSVDDFARLEARIRRGAQVRFEVSQRIRIADAAAVSISRPFAQESRATPEALTQVFESDSARERIFASIDYAQLPPIGNFYVRVFVNLPTASRETSTDDPHYAGSFAFFGTHHEGAAHRGKTDFLVNVTPTLQRLRQNELLTPTEPITIQLVAVPVGEQFDDPEAELRLDGIDLIVTPVIVR